MIISVYKNDTGEISSLYNVPNPNDQCDVNHSWIEGWYDCFSSYVADGEVLPRPQSTAHCYDNEISADGLDAAIISNIPINAIVSVTGPIETQFEVNDGSLYFAAAIPGTYVITIDAWPHKKWEHSINAI